MFPEHLSIETCICGRELRLAGLCRYSENGELPLEVLHYHRGVISVHARKGAAGLKGQSAEQAIHRQHEAERRKRAALPHPRRQAEAVATGSFQRRQALMFTLERLDKLDGWLRGPSFTRARDRHYCDMLGKGARPRVPGEPRHTEWLSTPSLPQSQA